MFTRWWHYPAAALAVLGIAGMILAGLAAILIYPNLPSLEALTDYQPKMPLRIYTADGALIGEFGEERRAVVSIEEVPKLMREAVLAAEDERFYRHGGVDYLGVLRAAAANLSSGGMREGASTITMQVARNFFLSNEKTLTRKLSEALLALKIEHSLTKNQIFELYVNQIYLGQRAYGFAAASQIYFGRPLDQLNLAEMAMLAGLPKAPSRYNPVVNPKRAKVRQHYVLRRMRDLNYISNTDYGDALEQPLRIHPNGRMFEVNADYVAEMVRQLMFERYHEAIYSKGFNVYTTLRMEDQAAANLALRQGVLDYDRRHGYRGPEGFVEIPRNADNLEELLDDALQDIEEINGLLPAIVLEASANLVKAYHSGGEHIEIKGEGLQFAQKALGEKTGSRRLRRGSLIRVQKDIKGQWQIVQQPQVEAALVSVNPGDGAIHALVGGFDFGRSKFNHVTQAWRQPGSSFKPFIYSAALEKGFTAASIINDAPLVLDAADNGGQPWEPKNFDGSYSGPIRLRTALTKSKNMASIRILQTIGPAYAQDYITRFGFGAEQHPPYLSMALGAGAATPLQMVTAYSVFANGGYRINPYFIERILDARGNLLLQSTSVKAGDGAERAIDARNAFIMTNIMQDVVKHGTAARAMELGRHDLAGKTGTTNDQVDAWFAGFNTGLVAVAWIGFDQPRSLGSVETGAQAALPMWMGYMDKALKNMPEKLPSLPEGVVTVKINPDNGVRVIDGQDGLPEYFYQENLPPPPGGDDLLFGRGGKSSEEVRNLLF